MLAKKAPNVRAKPTEFLSCVEFGDSFSAVSKVCGRVVAYILSGRCVVLCKCLEAVSL